MSTGGAEAGGGARRRSLLLVAGVALVVVAVVAGMVMFGEDESAPPTKGHASTLEPLALGDQPLWTADRLAGRTMADSPAITIRDDAALLRRLTGGSPCWTWPPGRCAGQSMRSAPFPAWTGRCGGRGLDGPLLRSHDGTPAVLIDYWYPAESGRDSGVALLSAETGEVLWHKDIPQLAGLGAADDRTVLVATTTGSAAEVDDLGDLKTLALDLGTGEQRWEQTGVWPDAISGDTALGHRSLLRDSSRPGETTVVALDLETGAPKWDLSERWTRSRLVRAAPSR